jgi:hypothetical protein
VAAFSFDGDRGDSQAVYASYRGEAGVEEAILGKFK